MDPERTYQSANEVEHTTQQQPNGGKDLEQRLVEQTPQRVELLLCVGHILKLALGIVDALSDIASEILEELSKTVLLRSGLASSSLVLGVGRDAAIRVEALDDALSLGQDAATLFD